MTRFAFIFSFLLIPLFVSSQLNNETQLTFTAIQASSIHAVDMDGDGDLDALSGAYNKVFWHENLGGYFNKSQNIITENVMGAVAFPIDMDNDGDIDVLSASYNDDKIAWYENLGAGNFGVQNIVSDSLDNTRDIFGADLDLDGDVDIVSRSLNDQTIVWYENFGGNVFSSVKIIYNAPTLHMGSLNVADVNGDGYKDIVIGSKSSTTSSVLWFENLGGGTFNSAATLFSKFTSGSSNTIIHTNFSDIDNDGDFDLVALSTNGIPYYSINISPGLFTTPSNNNAYWGSTVTTSIDLNNTGVLDVIVGGSDFIRFGGSGVYITLGDVNSVTALASGDIDGDGFDDLLSASASDNKLAWYKNNGSGSFNSQIEISSSSGSIIIIEDVNNDGLPDVIAATTQDKKLAWYENYGNGNFSSQNNILNNYRFGSLGEPLTTGDIDGDGDIDIIIASELDYKVVWFENIGFGVFGGAQTIDINKDLVSVVKVMDIDNDGDLDVISASWDDNTVEWYENIGNGTSWLSTPITSSYQDPNSISISDIDNDGYLDMAIVGRNNNIVGWLKNMTNSTFSGQGLSTGLFTTRPHTINTSDVDSDGDIDIISYYSAINQTHWFENLGGGIFNTGTLFPSNSSSISNLNTFDIDDDNDLDIMSSVYYQNTGVGYTISTSPLSLFSKKFVDFDGDGDLDGVGIKNNELFIFSNKVYQTKQITGTTYLDLNQSGTLDSLEYGLPVIKIVSSPMSDFTYSHSNGDYFMNFSDTLGTYQIFPNLLQYWKLTSDSLVYNISIDSIFSIKDSIDFGFYPDTIVDEINAEFIGSFPRCNDVLNYWLDVKNNGTTIPSGAIHLQLNDSIVFINSAIAPDSINGQNFYWHYDSLFYFSHSQINLQVQMPDFNSIGDSLTSYLNVSVLDSIGNQVFLASDTLNPILVCAYDPNDKIADPVGIDSMGYISANTQYIEYTIRFQNTGNDTAITVNILDQLDTNLIWNTLNPLASSHPVQIDVDQNGEVTFKFENILLPDSGADFSQSQGFVKYEIKLKQGLVPGTSIFNTANIYFDQNSTVVTNTKINTIYDCNGFIPNTISDQIVCQNDTIFGNAFDDLSTTKFVWNIPNTYNSVGSNFSWITDTSGTFNLTISATNSACNKDTTILLTINPIYSSNQNQIICQGDSLLIYGVYQNTSGLYYDSLQTISGCDSILSTTLTVNPNFTSNQNQAICFGDSILLSGEYQNTTGVYYDSLQTISGCDSILSTTLTIDSVYLTDQIQNICEGDSILIYGQYQTTANVYYDSLQTINGCDSLFSTTLVINPLPNVSLALFAPDTICDNVASVALPVGSPTGGSYSGNGVGAGIFDPSIAGLGTHDVIYTFTDGNACVNSDTTVITVEVCAGINEMGNDFGILIYPNPNTGLFTIEKPMDLNLAVQIKLLDATAKLIVEKTIPVGKQKLEIDITSYSSGIYYLQIITGDEVFVKQILKN